MSPNWRPCLKRRFQTPNLPQIRQDKVWIKTHLVPKTNRLRMSRSSARALPIQSNRMLVHSKTCLRRISPQMISLNLVPTGPAPPRQPSRSTSSTKLPRKKSSKKSKRRLNRVRSRKWLFHPCLEEERRPVRPRSHSRKRHLSQRKILMPNPLSFRKKSRNPKKMLELWKTCLKKASQ